MFKGQIFLDATKIDMFQNEAENSSKTAFYFPAHTLILVHCHLEMSFGTIFIINFCTFKSISKLFVNLRGEANYQIKRFSTT